MRGQRIAQQRQHITTATGWEDASQTEPGSSLMQVHPYSLRGAGVSTRVSEQALEKKKGCREALVSQRSLRTYPLHTCRSETSFTRFLLRCTVEVQVNRTKRPASRQRDLRLTVGPFSCSLRVMTDPSTVPSPAGERHAATLCSHPTQSETPGSLPRLLVPLESRFAGQPSANIARASSKTRC
jgi:hypothetical protein